MVYDEFAARMSGQYALFLFALAGRYHQLRAPGTEITPWAISSLNRDCQKLCATFYLTTSAEIDRYIALTATNAPEGLLTHNKKVFQALVRGVVADNLAQITKLGKSGDASVSDVLNGVSGAMGMLVQRRAGTIIFKATDTSGRRWIAKVLMQVIARDFAYQAYLDVQAQSLIDEGVDLVKLSDGRVISLMTTEGYLPFADVRGSVFHPNSKLTMAPYVPA